MESIVLSMQVHIKATGTMGSKKALEPVIIGINRSNIKVIGHVENLMVRVSFTISMVSLFIKVNSKMGKVLKECTI